MNLLQAQALPEGETAHAARAGRIAGDEKADDSILGAGGIESKRRASVTARAGLLGMVLHQLAEGSFFAGQGTWTCELPDLSAAECWLDELSGDQYRRERARRERIDVANGEQDRRDEALDLERGPGGAAREY